VEALLKSPGRSRNPKVEDVARIQADIDRLRKVHENRVEHAS
jgi:hypothetical protein